MVKHKLVSFATVVALWTLVNLLIKLIRMLLKWKYIHCKNYAILATMMRKRSYFVKKVSSRSPGLECSYGKIFIPLTEISVAKTKVSVTGPARALIWTHRNFYEGKSGEARSRKPSQPGWPGSYEEALSRINIFLICLGQTVSPLVSNLYRRNLFGTWHYTLKLTILMTSVWFCCCDR